MVFGWCTQTVIVILFIQTHAWFYHFNPVDMKKIFPVGVLKITLPFG
jgi:hypothetical protein